MKIKQLKYNLNNKKVNDKKNIIMLSDIHYCKDYNNKILDNIYQKIKKLSPNYICIVGDLVDSSNEYENLEIYRLIEWLRKLSKICKIVISIGNHDVMKRVNFRWDYDYNGEWFDRLGNLNNIVLLNNDNYIVDDFNFIGYTIPFDHYRLREKSIKYIENSIDSVIEKTNLYKYNILLCHSPIGILDKKIVDGHLIDSNIDLILCGHTHGGLMPSIIKGSRGIISPYKKFFPKNVRGIVYNGNIASIISYGVIKLSKCTKVLQWFNVFFDNSFDIISFNGEK